VAPRPVAELLVERERAGVLDDHLEPDAAEAKLARLLVERVHERLADTGAARRGDDADPADPAVLAADAEVREPDRFAVPERDARRLRIEVERRGHHADGVLVHVERDEGALVRRVDERRELARGERARGP